MNTHAWISAGVAACFACMTAAAHADDDGASSDVARAETYAAAAFDAYSRKDYVTSVGLYIKALEAAPSADIVYNLARIYDTKLKERKSAIEYYRRYALDTGAEPSRLRIAQARLAELRELEAVANETAQRESSATQAATLAPTPTPPVASVPPAKAASPERGLSGTQVAGIVAGAVGVAGLGIGVGFGLSAKSDADVAHESCNGNACSSQRGVDASHDASHAATISTIAFIGGGALSALGVVLLLLGSHADSERNVARASFAPYVAPGAIGTSVMGRW